MIRKKASSLTKNRDLPELLAPAGSPEALYAAVSAGADAVYLGGLHSARAYAKNFDEAALADAGIIGQRRRTVLGFIKRKNRHDLKKWCESNNISEDIAQRLLKIARKASPSISLSAIWSAPFNEYKIIYVPKIL